MVNTWDNFERDKKEEVPIQPVNGTEAGPKIMGPATVVKFKAFADDPLPPTTGDRNWGAFVLILALVFAFLFGAMAQYIWHFL